MAHAILIKIDRQIPDYLDAHLICDDHGIQKTPAVNAWPAEHPRFHRHFTPTGSSWINQVERWFAPHHRRDDPPRQPHLSPGPRSDIRARVGGWNDSPTPFIWTTSPEQIPESLGRLLTRISGAGH